MSEWKREERETGQLKKQLDEEVGDWKLDAVHRTKRRKEK